ncbi:cardiac-enriched FHL2-interacting protein [Symphorus nematophorus]
MFKLGDKERQEKMLLDAKANEDVLDTGEKHAQHLRERNKSPTTHLKNKGSERQVAVSDAQRVCQVDQSIHQPNNPLLQTTSSSAVNRPRNTSVPQHLNMTDNSNPHEKLATLGQVYNTDKSKHTPLRKDENIENALAKTGEERSEKLRQERLAVRHEETTAKQGRAKQLEEEQVEKRAEDMKIKHMIDESRASLAEEERRATQREEERRAREREAIAIKIKERREKQREAERRAEEERKAKQIEEERAAQKEEEMRAKQREEERRIKERDEKRKIKIEEEKRAKLRGEEEWIKENERRAAQEEQQRRVAQEEERQRRAAQEEKQRRAAQEEEQRRRAAQEEERQRKAAQEEEQRRRAAQEEQQRRAAQEEEQRRRAAQEEEQRRRAAQEEQQRRAAQEQQQRRAALIEEQQGRTALIEEQRRAKQIEEKILNDIEEEKKRKQREEEQKKAEHQTEEQRSERQKGEKWMRMQREEEEMRAVQKENTIIKQGEEKQAKEEMTRLLEANQIALKEEETKVARERVLAQREDDVMAKKREEEEKLAAYKERERVAQIEEQKRAAQKMDALQYYAITSTESERKPKERQLNSPLPSRRHNPTGLESTEDSHPRPSRPHAPASPAPSLPRSNTSSPAFGAKPLMFRVKDNTIRGSSLTKSVKPRFHKNFGEDFRVGSPMGSERGEEEQETMRRSIDSGLNRLASIKESSNFQPGSSSQDYSAPLPHYKPYSRRSIALDEDDSRSVISNMSEDVESFATSAADLADVRGLYDYERPESACSFSSDLSRSLGKPPAVPPKSEKALRRAKRLTTRRIKKELSKAVADSPAGVEKPLQEVSSTPSSSASTEVRSSNHYAVASPHFSPPVSLAHAPTLGSSLPSSHAEHQSSHSSFYASPHATGPISLPAASPHATAPISIPVASPHATGPASHPAATKTVADVPSSPTLHRAKHPAPVTQYHVESSYPQSYPLTQRKVLQDLGSGQYFVVDVPVQVKTKTFFDPETGKYVQLNVRESSQSVSRPQPQQTYLQPQLKAQIHGKPQQQPLSQDSPAGKPLALYQGYHGYPQGYQPAAVNCSSAPVTLHQDQQPVRESRSYGYPAPEMGQNSEGRRYSPEKTPYMDTVNDKDKTYNTIYNTHGPYESFPECDTNSQLAGSSVCENDNSAHSRYQPRDIITMSELEDFMELSDW